jgi:hypothetical protein
MKLVLVSWLDIMNWSGWNDDLIKDGKDEPKLFHTIGFQVNRTKTKLTISDTWPDVGAVTTFPMGCVQNITEIKVGSRIHKAICDRTPD